MKRTPLNQPPDLELDFKHHKTLSFRALMQFRVHDILIVASMYDAFKLEEGGHITEMVFMEYHQLNLNNPPHVIRVSTAREALEYLEHNRVDLVITMARLGDMNAEEFGERIRNQHPNLPLILLAADKRILEAAPDPNSPFEFIFAWVGTPSLLPAIIKVVEDKHNAERDILEGSVRCIIVVEDSPQYYSVFMSMIYREIIQHTQHLMRVEYTDALRLLRMRSRPKILLATTYEEALAYFNKFQQQALAVISDVRYPKNGVLDPDAGVSLLSLIHKTDRDLPVVLQSKDRKNRIKAQQINAYFLDKNSPRLVKDLREFVVKHCGFGNLVYSSRDGTPIEEVNDLKGLEHALSKVPDQSVEYHARRNHFSNWLAARGYFQLADQIKPLHLEDFAHVNELRKRIVEMVSRERGTQYQDKILDFVPETYDPAFRFVRFGAGSLGGKARGLAFVSTFLRRFEWHTKYPNVVVDIPHTSVVATDIFDQFIELNRIQPALMDAESNDEIDAIFRSGRFPESFVADLRAYLEHHRVPLAVRSSSLLEDSMFQPFAGIYSTFMLPNNTPRLDDRLQLVLDGIKMVYASTFHLEAQHYMTATGNRPEDEKMAVIIQNLVGSQCGEYFYPTISGIAQSYNYYPFKNMKREYGIANVALGLGRTVVLGNKSLSFCPKFPKILPQFFDARSVLKNSQNTFFALPMNSERDPLAEGERGNLELLSIQHAEKDGTLEPLTSVYDVNDNTFVEAPDISGPRVISFANILKWNVFPLADILQNLLHYGRRGMGCEVEIEFAADVGMDQDAPAMFNILQIRPMLTYAQLTILDPDEIKSEDVICTSDRCLGHGTTNSIKDIILIRPDAFNVQVTREIASEIAALNRSMDEKCHYLLMGPGRWGTADPFLGIPVNWDDISQARGIVEVGLPKLYIEPSFGSHFFQNLTTLGISYFTIPPEDYETAIDWDWLSHTKAVEETKYLRHLRFKKPLPIRIDGRTGFGAILKPGHKSYINDLMT
ncbi:MAG: hypothetical protein K9M19_00415 [Candidatus Marinimicrobia bacterium]|nr:hypothetical protein [Candidatus Neomarinimicrobiota bacterium]